MIHIAHDPWLQDLLAQQDAQRAVKRLTCAVAQQLRLDIQSPSLILAPLLGQPITLNNQEALEQWVQGELDALDLTASTAAVEPLRIRLVKVLDREAW